MDSIYENNWQMLRNTVRHHSKLKSVRHMILMTHMRATKEIQISVGGLTELTYAMYMSVVKTSYSFLTLLLYYRN